MSVNEELEEHVQHARDNFEKIIAGNMAIVAALLAIVSVLGQHFNTEELLKQQQSSDQWAYYQAKETRRYMAQAADDLLNSAQPANQLQKYKQDATRYRSESSKIQEEARNLEAERDASGRKANQFHVGEVFLEVSIVLLSLSILTKRRLLAYAGFGSALVGLVLSLRGFLT